VIVVGWRSRLEQSIDRARAEFWSAQGFTSTVDDRDAIPSFGDRRLRSAFSRDFGLERERARAELVRLKREKKARENGERTAEQRRARAEYQRSWYQLLKTEPERYARYLEVHRVASASWRQKDVEHARTLKRASDLRRRADRNARRRAARLADPAVARERDRIENARRLLKNKQRSQVETLARVLAEEC
jgi:hypothetical protein